VKPTLAQRIKGIFGAGTGAINWTSQGGIPTSWDWNWWQQGKKPYQGGDPTAIVFACASAYSQTIASLPATHWRETDDGGRVKVTTSAAHRLMKRPNDYETGSSFRLNYTHNLMTHGNAYAIAKFNKRMEPEVLHCIPAKSCNPYIDPDTKSVFYAIGGNPLVGEIDMLVPAREVLTTRLYAPRNPLVGVSPIEYATLAIATNNAISNSQVSHFSNFSRTVGMLGTDMNLTAQNINQLRAAWEAQTTGSNQGGTPIMGSGFRFYNMQPNATDAQLIESFRLSSEQICQAFRVPPPIIGDLKNSTFNNAETLLGFWLATGLSFVIDHIEQSFAKFFNLPDGEYIEFDTDYLMRTDLQGRMSAMATAINSGIMTINDARRRESMPPIEGGDSAFLQRQNVPIELLSELAALEVANMAPQTVDPAAAPAATTEPDGDESDSEDNAESKNIDPDVVKALTAQALEKMRVAQ